MIAHASTAMAAVSATAKTGLLVVDSASVFSTSMPGIRAGWMERSPLEACARAVRDHLVIAAWVSRRRARSWWARSAARCAPAAASSIRRCAAACSGGRPRGCLARWGPSSHLLAETLSDFGINAFSVVKGRTDYPKTPVMRLFRILKPCHSWVGARAIAASYVPRPGEAHCCPHSVGGWIPLGRRCRSPGS